MRIEIGNTYTNKSGEQFSVERKIDDKGSRDRYLIRFIETGNYQYAYRNRIASLNESDISKPIYFNVGFAESPDKSPIETNCISFDTWMGMIQRCYSNSPKNKAYKDVSVHEEWHNYYNFSLWFKENYPLKIQTSRKLCLDKDLFAHSDVNKIYSPQTCCFLPTEINSSISGLRLERGNIPECVPAETVYTLSELVNNYRIVLSEKVLLKLDGVIDKYKSEFKDKYDLSFTNTMKNCAMRKIDLSGEVINGIVRYKKEYYEFWNLKQLDDFLNEMKKKMLLEKQNILK